jgi:hypothetical protein
VANGAWQAKSRATSWSGTLRVAIYPIDGDGSDVTRRFIEGLSSESFRDIASFMTREAQRYGRAVVAPVSVALAPQVREHPPAPPAAGNVLGVMAWSLRLRYWAWRIDTHRGPSPHVRLFVLFHDPARVQRVPHSLGLERGMLGVVHAFAGQADAGANNFVIAHELLHTLGASDKYDPATTLPRFPEGYAEPGRVPRYPQDKAEIMGGRVPLNEAKAETPPNLEQALIGRQTAAEIGLLRRP